MSKNQRGKKFSSLKKNFSGKLFSKIKKMQKSPKVDRWTSEQLQFLTGHYLLFPVAKIQKNLMFQEFWKEEQFLQLHKRDRKPNRPNAPNWQGNQMNRTKPPTREKKKKKKMKNKKWKEKKTKNEKTKNEKQKMKKLKMKK